MDQSNGSRFDWLKNLQPKTIKGRPSPAFINYVSIPWQEVSRETEHLERSGGQGEACLVGAGSESRRRVIRGCIVLLNIFMTSLHPYFCPDATFRASFGVADQAACPRPIRSITPGNASRDAVYAIQVAQRSQVSTDHSSEGAFNGRK